MQETKNFTKIFIGIYLLSSIFALMSLFSPWLRTLNAFEIILITVKGIFSTSSLSMHQILSVTDVLLSLIVLSIGIIIFGIIHFTIFLSTAGKIFKKGANPFESMMSGGVITGIYLFSLIIWAIIKSSRLQPLSGAFTLFSICTIIYGITTIIYFIINKNQR